MKRLERDDAREKRIDLDILADAYDEEERAMGWYYYLADTLQFPFHAQCTTTHHKSPLQEKDMVEVTGMAPENHCVHEIFVDVQLDGRNVAAPLAQLAGITVDDQTRECIADWHYWVGRGYGF